MTRLVLAEFASPEPMLAALRELRAEGRLTLDAYTPYPVHGLDEALQLRRSPVPLVVLLCGVTGGSLGYLMQWWMNAVDYRINVGNRPPHFPPAFVPIAFECTILFAVLGAFFSLMVLSRLPQTYHPVFELEAFRSASTDRFWISVALPGGEAALAEMEAQLKRLGAAAVSHVEATS